MKSAEFKKRRNELRLTQQFLGEVMGCDLSTIQKIETTEEPTKTQEAFINSLVCIKRLMPNIWDHIAGELVKSARLRAEERH